MTYKQRLFVAAYLGAANGNASEAARAAGYALPGIQGHENLKKPNIRAAIDAKLAHAAMSADEVLARLSDIASADLADFTEVDRKGIWKLDLKKAKAAGKFHVLKSIKDTPHGVAIELHDPLTALDKLGKFHGLWLEKPPPRPASDDDDDMTIPDDDDRPEPAHEG